MAENDAEAAQIAFGKNLTDAYLRAGYNQRTFAKAVGVSPQTVAHWEKGRKRIRPERMDAVIRVVSIDPNDPLTADDLWPGWSQIVHRPYGTDRPAPTTLRNHEDRIRELEATVDQMMALIAERPQDRAKLQQEAARLARPDAADAPPKRGRGRKR